MSLSDIERKRCERALQGFLQKRRPPPHLRSQVDIEFRIQNQSVEIFETRADWRGGSERIVHPFAKATFVRTTGVWRVCWRRADLKWHGYAPCPEVDSIDEFVALVDHDEYACFLG